MQSYGLMTHQCVHFEEKKLKLSIQKGLLSTLEGIKKLSGTYAITNLLNMCDT